MFFFAFFVLQKSRAVGSVYRNLDFCNVNASATVDTQALKIEHPSSIITSEQRPHALERRRERIENENHSPRYSLFPASDFRFKISRQFVRYSFHPEWKMHAYYERMNVWDWKCGRGRRAGKWQPDQTGVRFNKTKPCIILGIYTAQMKTILLGTMKRFRTIRERSIIYTHRGLDHFLFLRPQTLRIEFSTVSVLQGRR